VSSRIEPKHRAVCGIIAQYDPCAVKNHDGVSHRIEGAFELTGQFGHLSLEPSAPGHVAVHSYSAYNAPLCCPHGRSGDIHLHDAAIQCAQRQIYRSRALQNLSAENTRAGHVLWWNWQARSITSIQESAPLMWQDSGAMWKLLQCQQCPECLVGPPIPSIPICDEYAIRHRRQGRSKLAGSRLSLGIPISCQFMQLNAVDEEGDPSTEQFQKPQVWLGKCARRRSPNQQRSDAATLN
jgi:hypothetical protein